MRGASSSLLKRSSGVEDKLMPFVRGSETYKTIDLLTFEYTKESFRDNFT
jgi:hypothetical protein